MTLLDVLVLSIIQGITEFLPISSSGHLALWPILTGRPDQGVTMDVAVHLGTLIAVCWYFRRDLARMVLGVRDLLGARSGTGDARLVWLLALATVPAVAVGLALKVTGADAMLRTIEVIGWATLLGAGFLWLADRYGGEIRDRDDWGVGDAIVLGLAQALALVPGTSRSGITMTAARALGFERLEAAHLALLMAVPVILAASVLEIVGLVREPEKVALWPLALGTALSCVAALGALAVMFRMFSGNWTMGVFVLYRLVLGAVLLGIAYT